MDSEKVTIIGHDEKPVERDPIFLNDKDIIMWERPCPPGYRNLLGIKPHASTRLTEFIGASGYKCPVKDYRIIAHSEIYRANISRLDKEHPLIFPGEKRQITNPEEDCYLYGGGIVIAKRGVIPGTEIDGEYIERQGKIWAARPYDARRTPGDEIFEDLLFGTNTNISRVERIEQIIAGYEFQKRAEQERISDVSHASWERGRHSRR
ncbi:hypothetical protein KA107_03090 [Candidatus Pacearchaeota archaeon]|nr:hypothetical protein [Candidatus Pacearchaeota archaeon]